jgi:hypothetical protein
MNTAVVKASKAVKGITSTVRLHLDAVERAREIYLAHIKRAEAEYFERINRAMATASGDAQPSETIAAAATLEAQQAPAEVGATP